VRSEIFGTVSDIDQIENGSRYWLYIDGELCSVIVDITRIDQRLSTALLEGHTSDVDRALRVGESYPIITDFWNPYVYAAVLDENRVWTKTSFKAIGSFESAMHGYSVRSSPARPGLTRIYPSAAAGSDDSVRIVDGGWDHEHCTICNRHIDTDNPIGYVDNDSSWLCVKCHETFAVYHDLKFIAEYPEWGDRP